MSSGADSITDGHSKLAELEADYESALEDARGDFDEETIDGGAAFDLSISIALMYPQEVAEEFLRRQHGYVPQTYRNLIVHREK
jgi:hypothetical protein